MAQAENIFDFKKRGQWDAEELVGGVYEVPDDIKDHKVARLHAQWLSTYESGELEVSKNHMCFRLLLEEPYRASDPKDGTLYPAVMLSLAMEPAEEVYGGDVLEIKKALVPIQRFWPGMFTLKMLRYDTQTFRTCTLFAREYKLASGVALRDLIQPILDLRMDQFVFEYYTTRGAMKGCSHFTVRAYEVWVNKGLLTDPHSIEEPHKTFPQDLIYTYVPNKIPEVVLVGRGTFIQPEARAIDKDTDLIDGDKLWQKGDKDNVPVILYNNLKDQ